MSTNPPDPEPIPETTPAGDIGDEASRVEPDGTPTPAPPDDDGEPDA